MPLTPETSPIERIKQLVASNYSSPETLEFSRRYIQREATELRIKRQIWKDTSKYFGAFNYYIDARWQRVNFWELLSEACQDRLKFHADFCRSPYQMLKSVSNDSLLFNDISKMVDVINNQSLFTTVWDYKTLQLNIFTNWLTNTPLKTTSMVLATPVRYYLSNNKQQFVNEHAQGLLLPFLPMFPFVTGLAMNWTFKKVAFNTIDYSVKRKIIPPAVTYLKAPIQFYFWGAAAVGLMHYFSSTWEIARRSPKYPNRALSKKYLSPLDNID